MPSIFNKVLVTIDSFFSDMEMVNTEMDKIIKDYSILIENSLNDEDDEPNFRKPIIFTRDRKCDIKLRNEMISTGSRVVQFRADWNENRELAGIMRNEKIFECSPSHILIFKSENEEKSNGLKHIEYLAYKNKIPLKIVSESEIKDNIYNYKEEIEFTEKEENVKKIPKLNSLEYKKKMLECSQKYKKAYFENKKKNNMKFIDENEIKVKKNKKVQTKAQRKKAYKKVQTKEENVMKEQPILNTEEFE